MCCRYRCVFKAIVALILVWVGDRIQLTNCKYAMQLRLIKNEKSATHRNLMKGHCFTVIAVVGRLLPTGEFCRYATDMRFC